MKKNTTIEENGDYDKLKLNVLKDLIESRNIPARGGKKEIIDDLILDDNEKFIRETTYEKNNGGFIVGIDLKNQPQLIQMGNLVFKKEAQRLNRYADDRLFFWSNQKLL